MSSNFYGIEIGLNALRSFKTAQEVIGNNISNVSTPGYVRREAVLQPMGNSDNVTGGVSVTNIRRLCDSFAQSRARASSGAARKEEYLRDIMLEAEQYLNPLTEGSLYDRLNKFWDSLQDLSNNPADGGLREVALAGAKNVALAVNSLGAEYSAMQVRLGRDAASAVTELNGRLNEVAALNHQIQEAEASGQSANTLRDQRDLAVDFISGSISIDVYEGRDGLQLNSGGQVLVFGSLASSVSSAMEGVSSMELKFRVATTGQELEPSSGKLLGMQASAAEIEALRGEIQKISDSLTSGAAGSLNAIHRAGYTLAGGASGEDLFNLDSSGLLRVNPNIAADPSLLAAAQAPYQGDGGNAAALAAALKGPLIDSMSPADFLSSLAAALGIKTEEFVKSADRAVLVEDAALTRVDSMSGVSLDEETARLLELQTSYSAAAKFISVANTMLDELLAIIR